MLTQIPTDTLSPIAYNQTLVITTDLLAQLYGTERQRVTNNFNRNKQRFIEGKHYFMAKGERLENLKNSLRVSQTQISSKAHSLILWTERGAARHAKMLETDQAWEIFEKLEDCYFNKALPAQSSLQSSVQQTMIIKDCAITQLNAMFLCAEQLCTDMWPHLSKLIPGLDQRYLRTFETLAMAASLLKETREECRLKAERIMARR